jgi:diguanylate cyclase (GGDEF)-like protein
VRSSGALSRVSIRAATVGLVAVVLVLTGFAATAAVVVARAGVEAQESATVRELSGAAQRALVLDEEAIDVVLATPDARSQQAYAAAAAITQAALLELGQIYPAGRTGPFERAMERYATYTEAVPRLFVVAERDPSQADAFENDVVDPAFDDVLTFVEGEADRHWRLTSDALEALGRWQRRLLPATALVFGLGLGPLAAFVRVLRGHQRKIVMQGEENRYLALHDPLTGLPNRTLLRERTDVAIGGSSPVRRAVALLLIDLDRFKEVNDTLGHHYGDLVLQAVAARLTAVTGPNDTVARLGGDEFALLLPEVDDVDSAVATAAVVRAAIEQSIEADGVWLDVEASVGVVLAGVHGNDVETLMQHADIAMYVAKEHGLGVCVYDADFDENSIERLRMLGELRRAIDARELVLHYQPMMALADNSLAGVEALVRWNHPLRGLVPPDSFIPLAERTGLIRPLTRYVIDEALAQCRRWRDSGLSITVSVNISARNLHDERFVTDTLELLDKWRMPASCLELELTESAIMVDPDRARATLARLAGLGFALAIDDFGAGYTSLGHLEDLQVHKLKIDRSFVGRMTTNATSALIVRSLVDLGQQLGLGIVAEGVEDEQTWVLLAAMGCDVAQGYLMTRPLPAAELLDWLGSRRAAPQPGAVATVPRQRP